MRTTKAERQAQWFARMADLGFSYDEASRLRRIEMTLQRWAEAECGDSNDRFSRSIERDEKTEKPFWVVRWHCENKERRMATPDRERGALKRLAGIMAQHGDLLAYHQGDCRGCMLYVLRASDVKPGETLDSVYTRGVAVCY